MDNERKIKILIAEDHALMRECLSLTLRNEPEYEIVGEACSELQTVNMISDLRPDFILLDITSEELNGLSIIPVVREKSPQTKILLVTLSEDDDTLIIEGLKGGARGYLSRNSSLSDLKRAISVIRKDEMWVERKLVTRMFENEIPLGNTETNCHSRNDFMALTAREQEVLQLLVKGSTNKEIAHDLFICEKTVKSHLNRIFRKLNVSRRLEAILFALKSGMA